MNRGWVTISYYKLLIFWSLAICIGIPIMARSADFMSAGPLYEEFPLTLAPGHRTESLGPLFNLEQKESQREWGIPPLFSSTTDPTIEYKEFDFLYPLMTYDQFGSEYRWQFFQLLSYAGGQDQQENKARRFTLFPIYFQQRSPDPSQNYTALLPIYGHLKNRLFRDEIKFVMLPCYVQSRKKDVVTDNMPYPFFHLRHGDGLRGWQFWPLVGHEHKEVTTTTNGFGDVSMIPGHDYLFALWPVYIRDTNNIGATNAGTLKAALPLYSLERTPYRESTSVIWPFFTYVNDRQEKPYWEWDGPWPFITFARGEDKTINRFWPLFNRAHSSTLESEFYLWPVYERKAIHSPPLDRNRTRILFFLYSDTHEKNLETGAFARRRDFLPFFTYHHDLDGNRRFQILAPLEPFVPNNKSIERDWSPLWSLWRSEKNAKTGASSQSLLWNLYRRQTTPQIRRCSAIFGLYQYQSGPDGKRLRLFHIPVLKTKNTLHEGQPRF